VKKLFLLLLLLAANLFSFAQADSSRTRISLLTCAPGDELYSIFGHTAIRVIDSAKQTDIVFNYGTFDFNDPDFYPKFVRGKLDYALSASSFADFMYEYQVTKRDVTEQELHLTEIQKKNIQSFLFENLRGNNRYYKYDFLRDNCTTRSRDVFEKQAGMQVMRPIVPEGTSFRHLLHEYIDRADMPWIKLGIDLLMGSSADKALGIRESMFLPDYLMKGVDSAGALFQQKQVILATGAEIPKGNPHMPLIVLSVVSALLLLVSFNQKKSWQSATSMVDFLLCLITGMIGCTLLFTWFGTDHASFKSNYNLLWALPTNLVAAVFIWRKPAWLQKYFLLAALVYGLLLITWYWLPQELNPAWIPVTLLLFLRFARLAKS
jgi:hypothetical protein